MKTSLFSQETPLRVPIPPTLMMSPPLPRRRRLPRPRTPLRSTPMPRLPLPRAMLGPRRRPGRTRRRPRARRRRRDDNALRALCLRGRRSQRRARSRKRRRGRTRQRRRRAGVYQGRRGPDAGLVDVAGVFVPAGVFFQGLCGRGGKFL